MFFKIPNLTIEKSIKYFDISISEDEKELRNLCDTASAHMANKRYGEAIKKYQEIIELVPVGAILTRALTNLANCYLMESNYSNAIDVFRKITDISTEKSIIFYAWRKLGISYMCSKQFSEAIPCLERAIELCQKKNESRNILGILGNSYLLAQKYPEAINAFTKAIELDESRIENFNGLGCAYMLANDFVRGVGVLERGARIKDTNTENHTFSNLHLSLGCGYAYLNRLSEAINEFLKSMDKEFSSSVHYNLIQTFKKIGDSSAIINHLTDFFDSNTEDIDITHALLPLCEFVEDSPAEDSAWQRIMEFAKKDPGFMEELENLSTEVYFNKYHPLSPHLYLAKKPAKGKTIEEGVKLLHEQYVSDAHIYQSLEEYFSDNYNEQTEMLKKVAKPLAFFEHEKGSWIYMMKRIRSPSLEEAFEKMAHCPADPDDADLELLDYFRLQQDDKNIKLARAANFLGNGLKTLAVIHYATTSNLDENLSFKVDGRSYALERRNYESEIDRRLLGRFGQTKEGEELKRIVGVKTRGLQNLNWVAGHGDFHIGNVMENGAVIDPNRKFLPAENDIGQLFARLILPDEIKQHIIRHYTNTFCDFQPITDFNNFYANCRFFEMLQSLAVLGYTSERGDYKMVQHHTKKILNDADPDVKEAFIAYFDSLDERSLHSQNLQNSLRMIRSSFG